MFNDSDFSKDVKFNFTGDNEICPDNNCKPIFQKDLNDQLLVYTLIYNDIGFTGSFQLQDNKSFANYAPLKRGLVERVNLIAFCPANDIIEQANYTKYICKGGSLTLTRDYNNTDYDYTMNATFELPARHYVVHATTKH